MRKKFAITIVASVLALMIGANVYAADDCSYIPYPSDAIIQYGEVSYQLYAKQTQIGTVGNFVIHPTKTFFENAGAIEVLIGGQTATLFGSVTLAGQGVSTFNYPANSKDINVYFNLDFSIDTQIAIKHYENGSLRPSLNAWTMVVSCKSCLEVTMITVSNDFVPANGTTAKKARENNVHNDIRSLFSGGAGTIGVSSSERCVWSAQASMPWIQISSGNSTDAKGNGNGQINYTITKNDYNRDRTGEIIFYLNDVPFETIPVFQKDKALKAFYINDLLNPFIDENTMQENQKLQMTATVLWDDNSTSIITHQYQADDNLIWSLDSVDFATISRDGKISAKQVDGNQIVTVSALYTYHGKSMESRDPETNIAKTVDITVKDTSVPTRIEIKGDGWINEFSYKSYKANVYWSNRDSELTTNVDWKLKPTQVAQINDQGKLTAFYVQGKTVVTIVAELVANGVTVSSTKNVEIQDLTTFNGLVIKGLDILNEGDTEKYRVIADWSLEPDEDVTDLIEWSLDVVDGPYASIDSTGLLTTKNVTENKVIHITARFLPYNSTTKKAGTMAVTIQDNTPSWSLEVSGNTEINEGVSVQYKATVIGSDGTKEDVTNLSEWNTDSDIMPIDSTGKLVAGMIKSDLEIVVKACYTKDDVSFCDNRKVLVKDSTTLSLEIEPLGNAFEVNESGELKFKATSKWSNESEYDTDITSECIWSVDNETLAKINATATLLVGTVESDQTINVTANYSVDGKTAQKTVAIKIVNVPAYQKLVIEPSLPRAVDENTSAQVAVYAVMDNGDKYDVTADSVWSFMLGENVIEADIISVDLNGVVTIKEVDKTIDLVVTVSYADDDINDSVTFTLEIRDLEPESVKLLGNVMYEGNLSGMLFVEAFESIDSLFENPVATTLLDWPEGYTNVTFDLTVPNNADYVLRAFIATIGADGGYNGTPDKCEAQGTYRIVITNEKAEEVTIPEPIVMSVADWCSNASVAIDTDPNTVADIESTLPVAVYDEFSVAIVANDVVNLDTYQVEIQFDRNVLAFVGGIEDNPEAGITNILKINNGQTLGFQAIETKPGLINIANSLIGSDDVISPEGSGVLAILTFKVIGDLTDSIMVPSNVFFKDHVGNEKELTILKHANIVSAESIVDCNDQPWDFDKDGIVNYRDLAMFADHWLSTPENADNWDLRFDLNYNPDNTDEEQIINYKDLSIFASHWLEKTACAGSAQ